MSWSIAVERVRLRAAASSDRVLLLNQGKWQCHLHAFLWASPLWCPEQEAAIHGRYKVFTKPLSIPKAAQRGEVCAHICDYDTDVRLNVALRKPVQSAQALAELSYTLMCWGLT